jgi:hypothetical protein
MQTYQLDVVVSRGQSIESRHRVHAAVWEVASGLVGVARDPFLQTPWRSCAKPFQVMPFLETGGFDELVWGDDELALACASHGGEPEHIAVATRMLDSLALEEGDLACGPHEPLSRRGSRALRDSGLPPTRLHNNCSGKHAAMLGRAHLSGWPIQGYEREGHPVQNAALESVARWTSVPADKIERAVDGCGVVVFGLPIAQMSRACHARRERDRGDEIPPASPGPSAQATPLRQDRSVRFHGRGGDRRTGHHQGGRGRRALGRPARSQHGGNGQGRGRSEPSAVSALLRLLQLLDALPILGAAAGLPCASGTRA